MDHLQLGGTPSTVPSCCEHQVATDIHLCSIHVQSIHVYSVCVWSIRVYSIHDHP